SIIRAIVSITTSFGIDGHRADITMMKAAKANAALDGRTDVNKDDIRVVAALVLSHRMRRRPFEEAAFDTEELERCLQSI
ncbi:MAG: magnesium chelatase ATPase subunit I, partial [Candidatus Methanomethylophilaceae archaeon]|nr:magnesium chelatase ATPase subunit I [Candidatus Methanomethylophilaceae archaeon]